MTRLRSALVLETVALRKLRPEHRGVRRAAGVVSDSARGGALWAALSAAGALSPRTRAAARDGVVAWAAASTGAFAVKRAVGRQRPRLPGRGSAPQSSSMPSSHTTTAFAYATAATARTPATGVVLVPIAAAVAWSRTATSRHFPTDVAAGIALGVGAGALVGVASRRLAPDRSGEDGVGSGAPA